MGEELSLPFLNKSRKVSIIIPTFNRVNKLGNLLSSLEIQSFKNFKVIIVIDGSKDGTEELNKRSWNLDILWIAQENKGRAGARNRGLLETESDIIIFIDDDITLKTNSIDSLLSGYYNTGTDSIHFGNLKLSSSIPQNESSFNNDFHFFRLYAEEKWKKFSNSGSFLKKISFESYFFTSALLLIPRSILTKFGEFDTSLRDSEDFDLSMRLLKNSIEIYFNRNAVGIHHDFLSADKFIIRQREYLESKRYLLLVNPEYSSMHPGSFNFKESSRTIASLIFLFDNLRLEILINSLLFRLLPRRLKFYLIDYWLTYKVHA